MLVLSHATLLYIEDSRCWLCTANILTYGPPHTVAKFPGVCAQPSSLSLLSQPADAQSPSSVSHMRSHMSVKTQDDPLNLHIFHLDVLVMKNKSNKDLRWLLFELLKSSKILFTV